MIAHAIGQAIDEGFKYYDFLRGDEHYKAAWGAQRIGLLKAWMIPPTLWARSVYFAGEGALALRAAYRQLRKPPVREIEKSNRETDAEPLAAAQSAD